MPRVINAVINKLILWVFKIARVFMEFPGQLSFVGRNSSLELCQHIARMGHKRVLLVTDKMLVDLGLAEPLVSELKNNGTETIVYSGVLPDPTVSIVEEGLAILQQHDCDAVLALGGLRHPPPMVKYENLLACLKLNKQRCRYLQYHLLPVLVLRSQSPLLFLTRILMKSY